MATANRQQTTALVNELEQNPAAFEFFQAVRLLLQDSDKPLEQTIKFKGTASLKFPAGDVEKITASDTNADWDMTVSFMSLLGSHGILPPHYTERVLKQIQLKDHALLDFINLLQQRSIGLFYQAWEKYHFYAAYEHAQNQKQTDAFSKMLYSISGFGSKSAQKQFPAKIDNVGFYSGFFANSVRSSANLQALVQSFFEVETNVKELEGEWLDLGVENCTRLSSAQFTTANNNRLGVNSCAGTKIWHCGHKVRIKLGPLNHSQFSNFLPNGKWFNTLQQLISLYIGLEFNFDIQLVLAAKYIKPAQLQKRAPLKLGWNSWLCQAAPKQDKNDIILHRGEDNHAIN